MKVSSIPSELREFLTKPAAELSAAGFPLNFIFSDDMRVGKNTAWIFSVPQSDALKICLHRQSLCFGESPISPKSARDTSFARKRAARRGRHAKELRFLPLWEESSKEAHEGGEECGADAARSPPPCDPPSLRAENIRFRPRSAAAGRRSAPLLMKSTVLE